MNRLEQEFDLIPIKTREPIGVTLQRMCQQLIIHYHVGCLRRNDQSCWFKLKTSIEDQLLAMVMLATDNCTEAVIIRKKAAGCFGSPHYKQAWRRERVEKQARQMYWQAGAALVTFQHQAVKDLFKLLTMKERLKAPTAFNSGESRAVAIMGYFYDIREHAERAIEANPSPKLLTLRKAKPPSKSK